MTTTTQLRDADRRPAPPRSAASSPSVPGASGDLLDSGARPRSPRRVWWSTVRYHLCLVRRQALAWAISIVAIGAGLTSGFRDLYPTPADREAMARSIEGVPAFEALAGRTVELGTVEGFIL